jgi:hypothetical protein
LLESVDGVVKEGFVTNKNMTLPPASRMRRVVFDHATSAADFAYSHASSTLMPLAPADMAAVDGGN